MARPLRIEYPGAFYHITSRGNVRQKIFKTRKDHNAFLELLKENIDRYNWECYAYCLMPNHYHLLIKTLDPNLSAGMRQLNGVYTQKFNYTHKKAGHLFQGRYKAILVDEEKYFYELVRYIVLNPVRAKISKTPLNFPWSSHREVLSKNKKGLIIEKERVVGRFDGVEEYKKYINQKVDNEDIWEDLKSNLILGSFEFIDKIKSYINKKSREAKDIKKDERYIGRPELKIIFKKQGKNREERNKLIYKAYREYGYSLSEIARHAGLHNSFVGKIVKRMIKDESLT